MSDQEYKTSLEPAVCATCGVFFGLDASFKALRKRDGGNFDCPNGHHNVFSENTAKDTSMLKERVAELEKELEGVKVENRRLKCELLKLAPTEEGKKSLLQRLGLT